MSDDQSSGSDRLHPTEDAELRRLHMLRAFGAVASSVTARYESLRRRDRRRTIREPDDAMLAVPVERTLWSEEPASAVKRPVDDSGEFFGSLPEPTRSRGIFRR